jgi:hypothetical protein
MRAGALAISAACLALGCTGAKPGGGGGTSGDRFVLFATTEVEGTIEPCGCTSDPMGDIARYAALVEATRREGVPVVVVDGGSLLYTQKTLAPAATAQEQLKASLLVSLFGQPLGAAAIGLGPHDLALGPSAVKPPRQALNLGAEAHVALAPPALVDAGAVRVGIFGVVSPAAVSGAGDPAAAATGAVADLRGRGARVIVALAYMDRMEAVQLARKVSGIDFMVVGRGAPEPDKVRDVSQQVGQTYLVQPANRGQVVSRLDVAVRGAGAPFVDAVGEGRIGAVKKRLAGLRADIALWEKQADADASFLSEKRREAGELEAELGELTRSPLRVPAQGSWFTLTQVRVRKALACDGKVVAAKVAYDRAAGQANVEAAKKMAPPPPPPPGTPTYVGMDECESCHQKAVAFWKTTVHARAWATLEKVGKQLDHDCTTCHVTGWGEPGGATMAKTEGLRDVQCEVCHGPGSIHVDKLGKDNPRTIVKTPRADRCGACHTPEHSDTFKFEAYLRDVTGPGHGEALRRSLGDGATGHVLRSAALEKAGREIGAGCPR